MLRYLVLFSLLVLQCQPTQALPVLIGSNTMPLLGHFPQHRNISKKKSHHRFLAKRTKHSAPKSQNSKNESAGALSMSGTAPQDRTDKPSTHSKQSNSDADFVGNKTQPPNPDANLNNAGPNPSPEKANQSGATGNQPRIDENQSDGPKVR